MAAPMLFFVEPTRTIVPGAVSRGGSGDCPEFSLSGKGWGSANAEKLLGECMRSMDCSKDDLNALSARLAIRVGVELVVVAPADDGNPSFSFGRSSRH